MNDSPPSPSYVDDLTTSTEVTTNKRPADAWGRSHVHVAREELVQLVVNGREHIQLVASPRDLEAWARGYLVTEAGLPASTPVTVVRVCRGTSETGESGAASETPPALPRTIIEVTIPRLTHNKESYDSLPRTWVLSTSGAPSTLAAAKLTKAKRKKRIVTPEWQVTPARIFGCQRELHRRNEVWRLTGGCHISGLFAPRGDPTPVCWAEDVGRHNTLDKVIGMGLATGLDFPRHFCITSGRLAGGMVAKVARVGIPLLVSNTAPLSTGIGVAEANGVTLVGFARPPHLTVYTRPARVSWEREPATSDTI